MGFVVRPTKIKYRYWCEKEGVIFYHIVEIRSLNEIQVIPHKLCPHCNKKYYPSGFWILEEER